MSLTVRERDAFLEGFSALERAQFPFKICEILVSDSTNPDSVILRSLNLNKVEKFRHLEELYARLLEFGTRDSDAVSLRKRHNFAVRLLSEMKFDAAEAVILSSLGVAYAVEDFDVMNDFFELEYSFPEERPLVIDQALRSEILRHQGDIIVFWQLLLKVKEVKDLPNIEHNRPVFETVKADALNRAEGGKLCAKAKYLFLKTITICHALLGEFEQMIPLQEALVAHLEAFPSSVADAELAWVKEMATLVRFLWVTRNLNKFQSTMLALQQKKFASKQAEVQRTYWRFPFILVAAIELGDQARAEQECKILLELLDNSERQYFKKGFVSQNLYECAYFYLVSGDYQMLPKVFGKMNRLEKEDFHPRRYAVSRLIKVVYEMEIGNWEDAAIHCNNLKKTKVATEFEGFEQILAFLQECIRYQLVNANGRNGEIFASLGARLSEALSGHWILNYFDILAWIEAKQKNLPLLTILMQRAGFNEEAKDYL